jgi:arylsulfatase/arylsulfatase A
MSTKTFLFLLALASGVPAAFSQPPNIVLIMIDDQGYGDLGVTGNPVLETPHIDRLAREGGTMATFYVNPVCSPTRASLLTGRYNYRTRVTDTFKGRSMMEPDETTLAEALRAGGYRTGIFGKWHLGDNHPLRPSDQGFDESLIHRGGGLGQPSEPFENDRRYTDAILFRNDAPTPTRGYCTDVFFTAALGFIDAARVERRPFFAYLAPNAPHSPYHDVPDDLYRKYATKDLSPVLLGASRDADTVARVFAMVENIDANVGRLLAHLERQGLAANTIVIFMTDNGPNTRRYVGALRGMKSEVYEGGIRAPFFLRWPDRVRAGTRSDRIAAHIDVMPTLLEAAGLKPPAGVRLDGRSFLPLLEGKPAEWPDRHLVLQTHRGDTPVPFHNAAIRNERWKLLQASGAGRETLPPDATFELYDLAADPGERHNRAAERPDVVRQLEQAYARWFEDVSTTRPDNFAPPRIVVGTPHETETVLTSQDKRVRENGWLLRFDRRGPYTLELRWKERLPRPGTVELRIGEEVRRLRVEAGASTARIVGLDIAKGDTVLAARVVDAPGLVDPPHIALRAGRAD